MTDREVTPDFVRRTLIEKEMKKGVSPLSCDCYGSRDVFQAPMQISSEKGKQPCTRKSGSKRVPLAQLEISNFMSCKREAGKQREMKQLLFQR